MPSDDPTDFGWSLNKDGVLLPDKCLKCVPDHKLEICKCQAGCERNCPCKKTESCSVMSQKKRIDCQNRYF